MSFHRNAKLGLAGRYALVSAVEGGLTLRAAAAAYSVSPATAHRWWHRGKDAAEEARATLSCLFDRSSRPRSSPRQLAETICACRRKTGWGPRLVRGRDRLLSLDGLEGARAGGDLAAAEAAAAAGQQLRVALPRRPAARGHQRVRALPAAGSTGSGT
jgi:hypothetical protein